MLEYLSANSSPCRAAVGVLYGVDEGEALPWVGQVDLQPSNELVKDGAWGACYTNRAICPARDPSYRSNTPR